MTKPPANTNKPKAKRQKVNAEIMSLRQLVAKAGQNDRRRILLRFCYAAGTSLVVALKGKGKISKPEK